MSQKKGNVEEPKLSAATVKQIAAIAAEAAVKAYCEKAEEERVAIRDKRFNNTKLLLRRYRELETYTGNAVYESSQLMDDDLEVIMEAFGSSAREVRKIQSIRQNVCNTRIIMEHVRVMLGCYERMCIGSNKPEIQRKWRVVNRLYISPDMMVASEVATAEHIGLSTVYAIVDSACEDLSTLFFGLDLSAM